MLASTSSSLSASAKTSRSVERPAWTSAGKKRSGRVRHHRIGPFVRAAMPATHKAAAAPSTVPAPPPANSCSAPCESPPPGSTASISGTPKARNAGFLKALPSRAAMRSRRSEITLSRAAVIFRVSLKGRVGGSTSCRLKGICSLSVPFDLRCQATENRNIIPQF